jgi:hypothetical protein
LLTKTVRVAEPHAPRKLHSFTEIVYAPSSGNAKLDICTGTLKSKPAFRSAVKAVVSPTALVTVNSGAAQARPPAPEEAERSMGSELQPRSVDAMDSTTTGAVRLVGATTWTAAEGAVAQLAHVVGCVHSALTLLLDRSVTDEPTLRSRLADTLLLGYTVIVESSAHKHVAAVSPGKLSRRVQVKAFVNPPLLVGASNFTSTPLPSLLNVADSSCGAAGVAKSLSTVKVPRAIGPVGYSAALAPSTVACTTYSPTAVPMIVTRSATDRPGSNSSNAGDRKESVAEPVAASTTVSSSASGEEGGASAVTVSAPKAASFT